MNVQHLHLIGVLQLELIASHRRPDNRIWTGFKQNCNIKGEAWQKMQQCHNFLLHCCAGESLQKRMLIWDPSLLFLAGHWKEFSLSFSLSLFLFLSLSFSLFSFLPPSSLSPSVFFSLLLFFPRVTLII